jgi:hypothetical protein
MVAVNGELEGMWKEETMMYFEVLSQNLTALSEEKHEISIKRPVRGQRIEH